MNKRTRKKRYKQFIDWFSREKIPLAFSSKSDRKHFCSMMARKSVNQKCHGEKETR